MTSTEELERLLAEAQTDEPWTVVWYGDDSLPAIAIHRSTEDRICFMPTIQHPADGVQFEANAALIVAAVNALPELVERVKRLEVLLPYAKLGFEVAQFWPDDHGDIDGFELFDMMVKAGVIVKQPEPYDPEHHDFIEECEPGDDWYKRAHNLPNVRAALNQEPGE